MSVLLYLVYYWYLPIIDPLRKRLDDRWYKEFTSSLPHLDGVLLGVPWCPVTSDLQLMGGRWGQEGRTSQQEDEDEGGDEGRHVLGPTGKNSPCGYLGEMTGKGRSRAAGPLRSFSSSGRVFTSRWAGLCQLVSLFPHRWWDSLDVSPSSWGIFPLKHGQNYTFKPTLKFHVSLTDSTLVTISRNEAISCLWVCQCSVSAKETTMETVT